MQTFKLMLADLTLNKDEIYLNLGYGGTLPDKYIMEMLDNVLKRAHKICHPQAGYILCEGGMSGKDKINLNGVSMKIGQIIGNYLQPASLFGLFVATAGKEYDDYLQQLKQSGDIVSEFLADAVGSEIAEATVRYVIGKITEEAATKSLFSTNSYSPGYCGWHVSEQKQLFSIFPKEPCGIKLNDSCLMYPVKSVSGIIGIGLKIELKPYGCAICGLKTCYKLRRVN